MTTFEIIILTALYLFAFSYMANSFGLFDKYNTRIDKFGIILAAATFGVIWFPLIFAGDIWQKLNS
jgi:hypothetical protein